MTMTGSCRLLVLALSLGLLHALSFAPWGNWWVQLLVVAAYAFLGLTMMRHGHGRRRIALAGLLFGFGWFLAGVGWLFVSMHTYGLMPAPLALLALVLFALYLGLFPGAALWTVASLRNGRRGQADPTLNPSQGPVTPAAWARFAVPLAATLTLAELLRGWLFTGFPWLAIGYAQMDGPLAGYAAIAGSYGVGFAACLVAGLLAAFAVAVRAGARWVPSALVTLLPVAAMLVLGHLAGGVGWSEPVGRPLKVRLLQGNVPQQMKFDPNVARQTMRRYLELVAAEPADLIVLPETAWTVPWPSTPPDIADRLSQFVASSGSAVAIGLPLTTPRRESPGGNAIGEVTRRDQPVSLTNSVLLLDRAAVESAAPLSSMMRYDKRHLVPFGEFVPWGFRWFVDLMTIPLGDFGRGSRDQPPFAVAGQRISFNICYEDAFGEELLPALTREDGATILANISNIAWFGDSHALPQHLQIARMRTLETARPMVRATNTGVTAAIDFDGKVLASLPPYQLGALSVTIQGRKGLTPYARTGNWPIAVLSLLLLAAAALPAAAARLKRLRPVRQTR